MAIRKRKLLTIAGVTSVVIALACAVAYQLLKSDIYVYDSLESALEQRGDYFTYLRQLHKAERGDTAALRNIFMRDDFGDGAALAQGWVMEQLINKEEENTVISVLQSMDSNHVKNVKDYLDAGIDLFDQTAIDTLIQKRPQVCAVLQLKK